MTTECGATTCECEIFSMDSKTPLRVHLSAYYKRSFAFYTIKERLPVILTKLIDYLVRDKENIIDSYSPETSKELKTVIGELSKLKYEIQTNKPISYLESDEPDTKIYNQCLSEQNELEGRARFFTAVWLHSECYMYRRIKYFFENTTTLKNFDYFQKQKQDAFHLSTGAMISLTDYLLPILNNPENVDVKEELFKLLKLNLWGNRCDLSISAGKDNSQKTDPLKLIKPYEKFILSNHSEQIWAALKEERFDESVIRTVDFINDNAGYEMFTDFCLADFIVTFKFAERICFNVKNMPWFISDTTPDDIRWIRKTLINNKNPSLKKMGIRWSKYIRDNIWSFENDSFWTLPVDYSKMKKLDPELYHRLSQSKLLIFKGDLNYRKLFGEMNWEPTTPITECLQGFQPTKLCTLRTLKADIICGLEKGIADNLDKTDPKWQVSGNYGVIQYSE